MNGITEEDKQRAILLSACGTTTYKLLKTLVAPAELTSKSFSELVKLAQEHYNPKPSVIMRRYQFNTCVRQEGESVTAYVTRLRDLASHCEYGDSAKELIRDRLVCGVRDDALQRTLLAVAKLTFDRAFELALLHESAVQNARLLRDSPSTKPVHYADPAGLPKDLSPEKSCFRCGGSHYAKDCSSTTADPVTPQAPPVEPLSVNYDLFTVGTDKKVDPYLVSVDINGATL